MANKETSKEIEEEFKKYRKDLDDTRNTAKKFNELDYIIYVNNSMEGRVILYYENKSIKYDGYCENGKYNGFGKFYEKNGDLLYEGFFKDFKYNGKGILYNNNKKVYEGEFKDNEYYGKGIEYDYNNKIIVDNSSDIKYYENPKEGKNITIYEKDTDYIIYKGDISDYKYNGKGILYFYDDRYYHDKIKFDGIFSIGKFKEGILYDKLKNKIYEGEFVNDKYEGNGTLYFEYKNKIYYKGSFKNGEFLIGELYDINGNKIYEGEFKNNFPKKCKDIKLYDLKAKNRYEGNINNFCFTGKVKIFYCDKLIFMGLLDNNRKKVKGILYENSKMKYEGEFKNEEFNGYGKLYSLDKEDNKQDNIYLYYEGYFKDNTLFGKGIKYYKNGKKKIEGVFTNFNSFKGIYYDPNEVPILEGEINNDILFNNEINLLYNDLGEIIYNNSLYNKNNLIEKKIELVKKFPKELPNINVLFIESLDNFGKDIIRQYAEKNIFNNEASIYFEFKNKSYILNLHDPKGSERHSLLIKIWFRNKHIFIININLDDDSNNFYFDNDMAINEIKEKSTNKEYLIYLLVFYENGNAKYFEKYRTLAKLLIDNGTVDKYFEIKKDSLKGLDKFMKILEIDAAILLKNQTKKLFYENLGGNIKLTNLPDNYELNMFLNY